MSKEEKQILLSVVGICLMFLSVALYFRLKLAEMGY